MKLWVDGCRSKAARTCSNMYTRCRTSRSSHPPAHVDAIRIPPLRISLGFRCVSHWVSKSLKHLFHLCKVSYDAMSLRCVYAIRQSNRGNGWWDVVPHADGSDFITVHTTAFSARTWVITTGRIFDARDSDTYVQPPNKPPPAPRKPRRPAEVPPLVLKAMRQSGNTLDMQRAVMRELHVQRKMNKFMTFSKLTKIRCQGNNNRVDLFVNGREMGTYRSVGDAVKISTRVLNHLK